MAYPQLTDKPGALQLAEEIREKRISPHEAVYASAKAGLNALTLVLAQTYGPTVRSNCVLPGGVLTERSCCYDMVYGGETAFTRWSTAAGATGVADGLGMLVSQAALAFQLWRGVLPEVGPVLKLLKETEA